MFPIPSKRKLSIVEIAKHWSREIEPPASPQELRDVISKAWWRGELIATDGASRLSILRGYYSRSAYFVAFAIPNIEEPPTSDLALNPYGAAMFVLHLPGRSVSMRICVSNLKQQPVNRKATRGFWFFIWRMPLV